MNCFVCSEYLNGDDQFIQSHLNRCLDRQGSSSSNLCTASSLATCYSQDEALALSLARQDQQQSQKIVVGGRNTASVEDFDEILCPCCQVLWNDIGLSTLPFNSTSTSTSMSIEDREKVEEKRKKHVVKCLEQRGDYEYQQDEDELQHGTYEQEQEDDIQVATITGGGGARGKRIGWNGAIGTKLEVQGTRGLLPLIRRALTKSHESPHGRTLSAYLASDQVEHIGTKFGDWGWGCGYKNLQMLISSARHLPQYQELLNELTTSSTASNPSTSSTTRTNGGAEVVFPIPTILELQEIIQTAWSLGYDPPGAAHFNYKLVGSRRWIGTTEVFTALSFLGFRAKIVDFPKVKKGTEKNSDGTHQTLIKWIISYFSTPPSSSVSPTQSNPSASSSSSTLSESKNAFTELLSSSNRQRFSNSNSTTTIQTVSCCKQPLYLQHSGHSRTIVGIERMKSSSTEGEEWLLIFDPGKPISNELKRLSSTTTSFENHRSPPPPPPSKKFKPNGFGRSKTSSSSNDDVDVNGGGYKFGDVLKVFRVNMKDLKKRDEYQILYIEEEGLPLNEREKEKRKKVMSEIGKSV